jgi:hypothetical protein
MSIDPAVPMSEPQKPGKVQAIAIMILVGGILATISGVVIIPSTLFLWPGGYYSLVMGIMAIIKGAKLIGQNGHWEAPPKAIAIMQIINIINCDIPNTVMGILTLVFLGEPQVRAYYQGGQRPM